MTRRAGDWLGKPPPATDVPRVRARAPRSRDQATLLLRAQRRRRPPRAGPDRRGGVPGRPSQKAERRERDGGSRSRARAQPLLRAGLPRARRRITSSLWQSHRYDVRAPSTFVSLRELSLPAPAHRAARAMPRGSKRGSRPTSRPPQLRAGRERRHGHGHRRRRDRPRAVPHLARSRARARPVELVADGDPADHALHRSDRRLGRAPPIEDIRIRNVETDLDERFASSAIRRGTSCEPRQILATVWSHLRRGVRIPADQLLDQARPRRQRPRASA